MRQNLRVRTTSVVRVAALSATACFAAVALAGCNTSPGAAALVGSQRITDGQLHNLVETALSDPAFKSIVGTQTDELVREQLSNQIILALFQAEAAQDHVTVTTAQVNSTIAGDLKQAGGQTQLDQDLIQNGEPPSDFRISIEQNLLIAAIATAKGIAPSKQSSELHQVAVQVVTDQTKRVGVHVDPRYGTWDPAQLAVEAPSTANAISVPAAG